MPLISSMLLRVITIALDLLFLDFLIALYYERFGYIPIYTYMYILTTKTRSLSKDNNFWEAVFGKNIDFFAKLYIRSNLQPS